MPSRAEVAAQATLQTAVVEMAWDQLRDAWEALDLTSESALDGPVIESIIDVFWDLLTVWGDVAATGAADFYDEMRARAGAEGSFVAILAASVAREQAAGTVRWALNTATPSGEPVDLEAALGKLQGPLQRLIRQTGRQTVDRSVALDPAKPRVARVPMGEDTCAFCLVLASRGPVYRSLESAGHDSKFHDFDDCEQVVVWTRDEPLPEGYDPGELYGIYEAGVEAAGTTNLRKVLAKLREEQGLR